MKTPILTARCHLTRRATLLSACSLLLGAFTALEQASADPASTSAGTLTLSVANAYAGATTINHAALDLSAVSPTGVTLTSSAINSFNAATLTLANTVSSTGTTALTSGGVIKTGAGTLTLSGANTFTSTTAINSGGLVLNGGTLTTSGATVNLGTSAAATSGAGTLILSGNNTYAGGTAITGGTLLLGTTVTQGGSNTVSVITGNTGAITGGTLVINPGTSVLVAGNLTANALTFNSSIYSTGTLNLTTGTALNGAGTLTLQGTATTNAQTLTLPVNVVNGSVQLNNLSGLTRTLTFTNPIGLNVVTNGIVSPGVIGGGALVLDTIAYTTGTPTPGFDYGTASTATPAATGDVSALSNTQVSARGSFFRTANSLKVRVEYGLDQTYGSIHIVNTARQQVVGPGTAAFFDVTLDWLQPGTTYHYRTKVIETTTTFVNGVGLQTQSVTSYGPDRTFTTSPKIERGPAWCADAPVTFNALQLATSGGTVLGYTPHLAAVTQGAHGATANDGTNVRYVPNSTFTGEDAIRVKVGFSSTGGTVITFPPPSPLPFPPPAYIVEIKILRPALPVVATGAAIVGSNSDVQLNATFTANGPSPLASFEYGRDTTYGAMVNTPTLTGPDGTTIIPSVVLTELQPETTYHFRARLTNSLGSAVGNDAQFTTSPAVDGGTYVLGSTAVEFNAFDGIQVPWETSSAAEASLASSGGVIIIGPGNPVTKRVGTVTQGAYGSVTTDGTKIIYTAGPTFAGHDSFLYRVLDPSRILVIGALPDHVPFWVRVEIHTILDLASVVATKGGSVAGGPAGAKYTTFVNAEPGIFAGSVQIGAATLGALFDAGGNLRFKVGDAAAGLPTTSILRLDAPSGHAALATLKIGAGGVTAQNDVVLLANVDVTPRLAARKGQELANAPGIRIASFGTLDGDGNAIFFLATLQGTGVTATNNLGLCAALPDGSVRLLVRAGQTLGAKTISTFATLVGAAGSLAEARWRAGDALCGVRLTFTDHTQAVVVVHSGSVSPADWTVRASTGDNVPVAPANTNVGTTIGLPGFAPNCVAFRTTLALAPTASDVGIVFRQGSEPTTLIAVEGGGVRDDFNGTWPGLKFADFADPVAGDTRVAFTATLAGTGVTAANRACICTSTSGSAARLLARAGNTAPGGGRWATFTSLALPEGTGAGPVFTGTLVTSVPDGVTAASNSGLWGVDSHGTLQLLLRTGQVVKVGAGNKTVASFTALTAAPGSIGAAHGYDHVGRVAATVTFTDRTVAVLKLSLP
jgi:autotransporter-associated beta strand protein